MADELRWSILSDRGNCVAINKDSDRKFQWDFSRVYDLIVSCDQGKTYYSSIRGEEG